jgi:hypothetical protein
LIDHNTPEEELFHAFCDELDWRTSMGEHVALEVPISVAMSALAALQLILRHPGVCGTCRDDVRLVAETMEKIVARTPAIAETCRRGWLPEYDREGKHVN